MEFTLLGAAVIAVASGWIADRILRDRVAWAVPPRALDLILSSMFFGVVAGRLWAMIAAGTNPLTNVLDAFLIRGGVDPLGASLGAAAGLWFISRPNRSAVTDGLAPVALWTLAGWHASCVVTGSCLGTPSELPWAVSAAGSDIGRHPVEIYAAILLAIGALALRRFGAPGTGRRTAGAVLVAAAARLVTEPLRLALGDGRTILYAVGVAAAVVWLAAIAMRAGPSRIGPPEGAQ